MSVLIVGASGATGKLLVEELLTLGLHVKLIVRQLNRIPKNWIDHPKVDLIEASILTIPIEKLAAYLTGCDAVASCLGHNLTLKGMFGKPRKLVLDAVQLICRAISQNNEQKPTKMLLMNTAGNQNRALGEEITTKEKFVLKIVRFLLPPHKDNESASDFLWQEIDLNNSNIEWVVIRPDSLTNESKVTPYELYSSPTRSAIFNPGKTSRINVANFMSKLITEKSTWELWKGQMPVIYNKTYQE